MLMNQIEALEAAKRRAASSYTRMVAHPHPQDTMQVTRDEQDVLCARVDVLNALLRQQSETPLCLEATGRKGPRVCVTYDRLRCEGELELGPMQSTMAWAVRDAEDAVLQLMSSQDSHPPAGAVKALLDLVRQSAPKKDILQGLHAALSMPGPERLVLKSLQGVNALETDGHTRVYEGLGEADGPTPPLYRVLWGALSLDVLEGWQNPSTNAAIRLSILHAAHQAAREAQQTKAPQWSNVAYLQVRVYHGDECHRLSLRPFWDSESCTVSHIQFRQSVFDDSGPERGLLNLGSDPNSIHPIPMGKILPLEAYVCLGAHRKSRLSEAQLNYVHAQGLLAHGFDTKLLPDSARLLQVQPGRMPPAKATRVSGDKLDVMASSFHLADQVYTTISVVQYPPFGTQFEKSKSSPNIRNMSRPLSVQGLSGWGSDVEEENPNQEQDAAKQQPPPTWTIPNRRQVTYDDLSIVKEARDPLLEDEIPLYKQIRSYKDDNQRRTPQQLNKTKWKKDFWEPDLRDGEHYFVDGVTGDPYKPENRFILFELDNGNRYKQAEAQMQELKSYFYNNNNNQNWDSAYPFYINIRNARLPGLDGNKVGDTWRHTWQNFIRAQVQEFVKYEGLMEGAACFWYALDASKWDIVLADYPALKEAYPRFVGKYHDLLAKNGLIQSRCSFRTPCLTSGQSPINPLTIPLPQTRLSARSDPAVSQLQSRIAALESKLGQAKQDENTQFLLAKVLDKLDAIEEV